MPVYWYCPWAWESQWTYSIPSDRGGMGCRVLRLIEPSPRLTVLFLCSLQMFSNSDEAVINKKLPKELLLRWTLTLTHCHTELYLWLKTAAWSCKTFRSIQVEEAGVSDHTQNGGHSSRLISLPTEWSLPCLLTLQNAWARFTTTCWADQHTGLVPPLI